MKGKELSNYAEIEDTAIRKYITAMKIRADGDVNKLLPGICNAMNELAMEHARAVAAVMNKNERACFAITMDTFNTILAGHALELRKAVKG